MNHVVEYGEEANKIKVEKMWRRKTLGCEDL
jgi:hypothetical protein